MTVGERILALRQHLGLNRTQFDQAMGLKSRIVSRYWERGMRFPNLKNAHKLLNLAREAGLDWNLVDFIDNPR